MKLDIQLFGGRGAKSSKVYTAKDIKKLYEKGDRIQGTSEYLQEVRGYELNGMYLLKNYIGGYKNRYEWVINDKEDKIPYSLYNGTKWEQFDKTKGKIIKVSSLKEGKEKLLKLANKRKKKK